MSQNLNEKFVVKTSKEELFEIDRRDVEVSLRVDTTQGPPLYSFKDNTIDEMDESTAKEHFQSICAIYKAAGFDIITLANEV